MNVFNVFKTGAVLALVMLAISHALGQPIITQQPTNQSVSLGANVTFAVTATGTAPLSYQWSFGGLDLTSATNRNLGVTNVQLPNAGDYLVVVANSSGSVTSQVAHLDVDPTFTKITTGTIVNDLAASLHCAWADYDDDGFIDLLVLNADTKNFLYHNNRDGTFTRITAGGIVNDIKNWSGAAWADYDNDGNLDVVIANQDDSSNPGDNAPQAVIYRNIGGVAFTRLPAQTIGGLVRAGNGVSQGPGWADYDNVGFVDLFVARSKIDWLYRNNGNGSFTSITNDLVGPPSEDSFEASWGDYNNDGRPDLFVAVKFGTTNRLYLNLGGGSFGQVTSGSTATDSEQYFSDCAASDYDNDGYLDLFVPAYGTNRLYHNNRNGTFTRMTSDVVGSIASDPGIAARCAWGDYDTMSDSRRSPEKLGRPNIPKQKVIESGRLVLA